MLPEVPLTHYSSGEKDSGGCRTDHSSAADKLSREAGPTAGKHSGWKGGLLLEGGQDFVERKKQKKRGPVAGPKKDWGKRCGKKEGCVGV